MRKANLRLAEIADCTADCIGLALLQAIERQCVGKPIKAAFIVRRTGVLTAIAAV
jgi:hypothetical protein